MDLLILPAGAELSALLAHHRCQMFRDMGILPDAHHQELFDRSKLYFEGAIPAEIYFPFVVAPRDEPANVIGGAGVLFRALMPRPRPDEAGVVEGSQGLVVNMYVEPKYRRRGVAQALLRHILIWCRSRGIASVTLHASSAGRPLYERAGFKSTNEMGIFLGGE